MKPLGAFILPIKATTIVSCPGHCAKCFLHIILSPQQLHVVDSVVFPVLQIGKLRLRDIKEFSQFYAQRVTDLGFLLRSAWSSTYILNS